MIIFSITDPQGVERSQVTMSTKGGWIGRAGDSEVRLDDAVRVVSSRHARVEWNGSGFTVQDQSSNGTDLNGVRLVKGQDAPLRQGDVLSIAGWRLAVASPMADPAFAAGVPPAEAPAAAPAGGLLPRFDFTLAELVGADAPRQPLPPPNLSPAPAETLVVRPPPPAEAPGPMASEVPVAPPPPLAPSTEAEALAAFWRGFGIAAPGPVTPALMEELGRALHDACAEATVSLQVQSQPLAQPVRDNPLAFGPRGQRELLGRPVPGFANALRAALALPAAREQLWRGAMEQAASRMAASLSATEVEARLARSVRARLPLLRRAELWRQFQALEGELREAAEGRFRKDIADRMKGETLRITWAGGSMAK